MGAIIYRYTRRLGSIDARRLLERDSRPPVLYLRAFGDDRLRLWTATLGRSSLIERFTLRRFDRFEEVLVRRLSQYGPVIAVNPPGTKLAPLGAARQTIENAEWHEEVAGWMAACALIVFLTPPIEVREGLRWELRTVLSTVLGQDARGGAAGAREPVERSVARVAGRLRAASGRSP